MFLFYFNIFFALCLYKIVNTWYNIVNKYSLEKGLEMDFVLKSFKKEISVGKLANIHYFEFTPSFHTTDDSHGFPELVYVENGEIDISSDYYTGKLRRGEVIIHTSGETHSLTCESEIAPNIIIIGFECASPKLESLAHAPLKLTDELTRMLAEIVREARTVYLPPYDIPNTKDMKKRKSFAYGADQLVKNYLQIFLIKALRLREAIGTADPDIRRNNAESINIQRLEEVRRYLDENFRERIGVEELCFLFNTNKTTLSREFKEIYGRTLVDYVNHKRIEYTKQSLVNGSTTLTKIAEELNMSSVHYLTTLFKKHVGVSPTEYLSNIKKM